MNKKQSILETINKICPEENAGELLNTIINDVTDYHNELSKELIKLNKKVKTMRNLNKAFIEEIKDELKTSLKEFGSYTMIDRGLHEVFPVTEYGDYFKQHTVQDVANFFWKLYQEPQIAHNDEIHLFIGAMLTELEEVFENDWDILTAHPEIEELY